MNETLAPQVRTQFARRLKAMRTQRGFQRARYFAASLGIEENRYTRYERAEVEPSLTLIHKMCETLQVTPNELLGFDPMDARASEAAGFAEPEASARAPQAESKAADGLGPLAWALASEMVGMRTQGRKAVDPLVAVRETSALYRSLLSEPFETIAQIAEEPALGKANAKRKAEVAGLIGRITAALRSHGPR
ncbi:MAG: helix-turn-helix transcriptional regulator [Hyphomicrobiaceae bacterium]|nr:helix-turn-helix transcriptional regulator [Hyphomicrobiaceae bacterium]